MKGSELLRKCPKCGHKPLILKRVKGKGHKVVTGLPGQPAVEIVDVQVCPECGHRERLKDRQTH